MTTTPIKKCPTIACCGLDCGLCPTYYTEGPSKCPGCCGPDFFTKHPSCPIITCCVKENSFETCAECEEIPCSKLKDWDKGDSFICHRKSLFNLKFIRENGVEEFIIQQKKRMALLEKMLKEFNDGRSKSFYCIAAALLPMSELETALKDSERKIKEDAISLDDLKAKSKILKKFLDDSAQKEGIELKLRKK